ncbi:MAG TPA: ferric reductase-like transmembrane domain-containing protein [Dehalococcoidia bacterium]|jgi:predicted ferric reductase
MSSVDHTYWYLNRAGGIVAYLLLFAALCLGLSMTGGALERVLRRYRVYDLHRFVSLMALGAMLFHVVIVIPDRFIKFSIPELFVPMASDYRPLYLAFGILSLYLTAVIIAAFYARHALSYRTWRLLHYATFAAFVLALAHGIGAGTESGAAWMEYLYAVTGLISFNLLVYRVLKGSARGLRTDFASPAEGPNHPAGRTASL